LPSDLFREQAIAHQKGSRGLYGQVTSLPPPSWGRITWLVGLFLATLAVFLLFVTQARTEIVRGVLRYDSAEARLLVQSEGYIHAIYVQEGDQVSSGHPIAEIRNDLYLQDGGSLSASKLESLHKERDQIVDQLEAIRSTLSSALKIQAQTGDDAGRAEASARRKLEIALERLRAAEKRRDDIAGLRERGLVAEDYFSQRVDAVAYLQQDLVEIEREISDARSAAIRASTEAARLASNADRELSELGQRLTQVEVRLKSAAAEAGYVIRAPHGGRVTSLGVRAGEAARPGVPLAVIVPNGAGMVAEFHVPSSAIGFMRTGQVVNLMYDAYPHQKFGTAKGEIVAISLIGQPAQELGLEPLSQEPLYRVYVRPEAPTLTFQGHPLPLQTGMVVSGEIILEERRLAEWLLEPFTSLRRR